MNKFMVKAININKRNNQNRLHLILCFTTPICYWIFPYFFRNINNESAR